MCLALGEARPSESNCQFRRDQPSREADFSIFDKLECHRLTAVISLEHKTNDSHDARPNSRHFVRKRVV